MICLLQKRAILRDQDVKTIPNTVPLDPTFRAKTVLLFHLKDYLARQKWRKIWTACVTPLPHFCEVHTLSAQVQGAS